MFTARIVIGPSTDAVRWSKRHQGWTNIIEESTLSELKEHLEFYLEDCDNWGGQTGVATIWEGDVLLEELNIAEYRLITLSDPTRFHGDHAFRIAPPGVHLVHEYRK